MQKNKKTLFWLILSSFLLIPLIVSVISSIHVINFFELSNFRGLAIALSVSFEIGALSALAGLVVMDKINKNVIYFIFILLTAYQMMGNTYYAYDMLSQKMVINPDLLKYWAELFGFEQDDSILMKRLVAIISGAILPIVSLCFLDLTVDYIKKSTVTESEESEEVKKKLLTELQPSKVEGTEEIKSNENGQLNVQNNTLISQTDGQNQLLFDEYEENDNSDIDESMIDSKIVGEEKIIEDEKNIENLFNDQPNKSEVISEDEKKIIRDQVEEIKKEIKKNNNKISINKPKGGFHNVIYTK